MLLILNHAWSSMDTPTTPSDPALNHHLPDLRNRAQDRLEAVCPNIVRFGFRRRRAVP